MTTIADSFLRLVKIMDELREQCPWDRKQDIHTLRHLTIEELYELTDAISEEDWKGIKEELGDLMLHIVFYAKIGKEQNQFTLDEVFNGVCDKLISRHPHIYGDPGKPGQVVKVENEDDVKRNWERLKLKEGKKSVLSGVPKSLPAMVKAMRLQEKAKQVGFEWENKDQVWEKVVEEISELQSAIGSQQTESSKRQSEIEDELGDVFFSLINYARYLLIDAENALERTNKKFIRRFTLMEEEAQKQDKTLHNMSLEEMDAIWNTVKLQKPS